MMLMMLGVEEGWQGRRGKLALRMRDEWEEVNWFKGTRIVYLFLMKGGR